MGAFGICAKSVAELACIACVAVASADASAAEPSGALAPPGQYLLDPARSDVTFDVAYFWHPRLTMRFTRVRAKLAGIDDGFVAARVSVTIDAASLEANVPFVRGIVEGRSMLDAARYPTIRFVSTRFVHTGASSGFLTGELTIRMTTRPVTLAVRFGNAARHASRDTRTLAFTADGHFSRAAFGLSRWPSAIGDDVHMRIQAEFVRERTKR